MNIFEEASKKKFRFPFNGSIAVEDLFDLKNTQLNRVYQNLSATVVAKDVTLLDTVTAEDKDVLTKIKIVKYIFNENVKKAQNALNAKARSDKKQHIMEIIERKNDAALENTSLPDLQEMLNDL